MEQSEPETAHGRRRYRKLAPGFAAAFSLSSVDSRFSERLTFYFRFAGAPLPPNFSE